MDEQTPMETVRSEVRAFVQERDWSGFHNPKHLATAISIEAAEHVGINALTDSRVASQP